MGRTKLAGYLNQQLAKDTMADDERAELVKQLAQFSGNGAIQNLLARYASSVGGVSVISRQIALQAMRNSMLKELPKAWLDALTFVIGEGDPALVALAVSTVRAIPVKGDVDDLKSALLIIANTQIHFRRQTRSKLLPRFPTKCFIHRPANFNCWPKIFEKRPA